MIVPTAMVGAGYTLLAAWPHFVALVIATILIASAYGGKYIARTIQIIPSNKPTAFWTGYNFVLNTFFGDEHHGGNFGFLSMAAVCQYIPHFTRVKSDGFF